MAFPSSVASFLGFTSSHTLQVDQHASQHNSEQTEIIAIENKLGIGASTPTNNTVLRSNGVGTTTYDQVHLATDVSGVLPVASGGTNTTTSTGTGSTVLNNSPTLVTPTLTNPTSSNETLTGQPTITDLTNIQHDHSSVSKGGQLSSTAFPTGGLNTTVLNNPYKFSVYLSSAQGLGAGAFTKITFQTKLYDTGSNFDNVTNFRFVAPVAGFYSFSAAMNVSISGSSDVYVISLYKNGTEYIRGNQGSSGTGAFTGVVSPPPIQLAATDFIEVWGFNSTGGSKALTTGAVPLETYFGGFLVSAT